MKDKNEIEESYEEFRLDLINAISSVFRNYEVPVMYKGHYAYSIFPQLNDLLKRIQCNWDNQNFRCKVKGEVKKE